MLLLKISIYSYRDEIVKKFKTDSKIYFFSYYRAKYRIIIWYNNLYKFAYANLRKNRCEQELEVKV